MPPGLRSFAAACLLALGLAAQAQAQTTPARVEELLRASGLWSDLAAIVPPGGSRLGEQVMRLTGGKADAGQMERMQRAFEAAFEAGRLRAQVLAHAAQRLQPDQVEAAIAWHRGDLGREVLLLGDIARRQPDAQRLLAHGHALLASASAERRSLLLEVTVVSGQLALNARIEAGMALAVQVGRGTGGTPSAQDRTLQAQVMNLELGGLGPALARNAAAYAALSDSQLHAYLGFLQSPAGRAVQAGLNQSFEAAVFAQSVAWGQLLGKPATPASQEARL